MHLASLLLYCCAFKGTADWNTAVLVVTQEKVTVVSMNRANIQPEATNVVSDISDSY